MALTAVTTVTTLWEGVLDLWSGHARLLPCLWCGLKGAPLYLGDSGDADDKNHGRRLVEVLGGDRSEGGAASGSLRDTLAQIRAGCAQGLGRTIQSSVTPNVEEHLFHAPR